VGGGQSGEEAAAPQFETEMRAKGVLAWALSLTSTWCSIVEKQQRPSRHAQRSKLDHEHHANTAVALGHSDMHSGLRDGGQRWFGGGRLRAWGCSTLWVTCERWSHIGAASTYMHKVLQCIVERNEQARTCPASKSCPWARSAYLRNALNVATTLQRGLCHPVNRGDGTGAACLGCNRNSV